MKARGAKELLLFFGLAYLITWVLWLPLILGKRGLALFALNLPASYASFGTIGPTVAALICHKSFTGNWRAFRIWTSWRPTTLGALTGSIAILSACFTAAAWTTKSGYWLWNWGALAQIAILFLPNLLGGPLGEEPGWRGFALPRLQDAFHPLLASVILGFLWASWHLPLLFIHLYSIPYWQYAPMVIASAIIIAFGFNISGGNTLVAIYLHGLLNIGTGIIMNDFVGKAEIRKFPSQGAVLVMSYVAVAALVAIFTRGRLGLRQTAPRQLHAGVLQ
jgi:membrane protease YdiL (CAAX protease family)